MSFPVSKPEFVFLKTMCGNKPSGKYGIYDKAAIMLCDNTEVPHTVVFIAGDDLATCLENATQKGIYCTTWLYEKDAWLAFAAEHPETSDLIQGFDQMWQRIVSSFITLALVERKPKGRKTQVQGEVAFAYDQEVQGGLRDLKVLQVCL